MKKEGNIKIDRSIDRPGVHAKTKVSKLKASKNYVKKYKGQGR
jgi:hypothetical protein